jgi:hypothetical protein
LYTKKLAAIDETGLIVGPIGHGVAFIDGSSVEATDPTLIVSELGATPSTGPLAGGTTLTGFLYGIHPTQNVTLTQMYAETFPASMLALLENNQVRR